MALEIMHYSTLQLEILVSALETYRYKLVLAHKEDTYEYKQLRIMQDGATDAFLEAQAKDLQK